MHIVFDVRAQRDLKKLDAATEERIIKKLEFYATQARPARFAERLVNTAYGQYRFRIGDYRIICDLTADTIQVFAVGHRRDIYR